MGLQHMCMLFCVIQTLHILRPNQQADQLPDQLPDQQQLDQPPDQQQLGQPPNQQQLDQPPNQQQLGQPPDQQQLVQPPDQQQLDQHRDQPPTQPQDLLPNQPTKHQADHQSYHHHHLILQIKKEKVCISRNGPVRETF